MSHYHMKEYHKCTREKSLKEIEHAFGETSETWNVIFTFLLFQLLLSVIYCSRLTDQV